MMTIANDRPGRRPDYLPTLDGWRAVAIGFVLFSHSLDSLSRLTGGATDALKAYGGFGNVGVRIFFAISGFLICSRLIAEHDRTGSISLRSFYIRRVFRILPPFVALLAVVALLAASGEFSVSAKKWAASLFFVYNYYAAWGGPANQGGLGHVWSLSIEEQFYILVPGRLVAVGMRRGLWMTTGLAVGVAAWRAVAFRFGSQRPGFDNSYFMVRSDIIADGLLWGCALAFMLRRRENVAAVRRLLRPAAWWLMVAATIATFALSGRSLDWKLRQAIYSAQSAVFPLLLAGTTLRPGSFAGRILESGPLRTLGRYSYSLYLWQQLFLLPPTDSAGHLRLLQAFPVNLVAAAACAWLSYRLIEAPSIRLGHRLAKSKTARFLGSPTAAEQATALVRHAGGWVAGVAEDGRPLPPGRR